MTEREELRVPGLPEPISHYTDAVRFGDLLLVSGCAPLDEDGNLVGEGDVGGQTRQVLESMDRILRHAGASFADVLKVTVFMTDVSQRRAANTVRQEFFGAARPASTLIEVSALAVPGMLIEIEAIVGLPGRAAD
jgi:2-iminobutanoate/2-iminopropanoate deaminase